MAHCIRSYKHNEIAQACKTPSIQVFTLMEKYGKTCADIVSQNYYIFYFIGSKTNLNCIVYCTAGLILNFLLFITTCCYENVT